MPDPVLAWCDDIHSVRGNVSQLQATLNQLITRTPTVANYKTLLKTYDSPEADKTTEAPSVLEKLRSIMHSPQVKVAVRLKSLYDKGYLPFLLGLSRINFKSQKNDRFVGYLLDYMPPKTDGNQMFPEEGDAIPTLNKDSGEPEPNSYPPSLPPIENESLLKLVLTDKSLRQPSDFLESEFSEGFHDYSNNHNRKLMLRGKDILNLLLNDILCEALPKIHEDDLEFLKYRLTSTLILAKLAFCYSLSDSIMHQIAQDTAPEEKLVVFKNVFLAYIGGMSKSEYTLSAIRLWVGRLYEPLISKFQAEEDTSPLKRLPHIAYAELNFMLRRVNNLTEEPTKRIKYGFKTLSEEIPTACQLVVSGVELGLGTGSTFEEARAKAAYMTFETPQLRSQLQEILMTQIRTPLVEKEDEIVTVETEIDPINSYSPEVSDNEYDPELTIYRGSSGRKEIKRNAPPRTPALNYGGLPPLVPQPPQAYTQNGIETANCAEEPKIPPSKPDAIQKKPQNQALTHNAADASSVPPAHARMPLPYGKLPPIPKIKKKGGKPQ